MTSKKTVKTKNIEKTNENAQRCNKKDGISEEKYREGSSRKISRRYSAERKAVKKEIQSL